MKIRKTTEQFALTMMMMTVLEVVMVVDEVVIDEVGVAIKGRSQSTEL